MRPTSIGSREGKKGRREESGTYRDLRNQLCLWPLLQDSGACSLCALPSSLYFPVGDEAAAGPLSRSIPSPEHAFPYGSFIKPVSPHLDFLSSSLQISCYRSISLWRWCQMAGKTFLSKCMKGFPEDFNVWTRKQVKLPSPTWQKIIQQLRAPTKQRWQKSTVEFFAQAGTITCQRYLLFLISQSLESNANIHLVLGLLA